MAASTPIGSGDGEGVRSEAPAAAGGSPAAARPTPNTSGGGPYPSATDGGAWASGSDSRDAEGAVTCGADDIDGGSIEASAAESLEDAKEPRGAVRSPVFRAGVQEVALPAAEAREGGEEAVHGTNRGGERRGAALS